MKIIGLTGPSGAGKGAVAEIFAAHGIPSVNADLVYHGLLSEKNDCTAELVSAFGANILNDRGLVDRRALAAAVFGHEDTSARVATLNAVTHKYIMAQIRCEVQTLREEGVPAVLIDAPQLFEANADKECDTVLGVLATPEVRLARIMARDGIDEAAARRRMAAQYEESFWRANCDLIIENNGSAEELKVAVERLFPALGLLYA